MKKVIFRSIVTKIIFIVLMTLMITVPIFTVVLIQGIEKAVIDDLTTNGKTIAQYAYKGINGSPINDQPIIDTLKHIENLEYALTIDLNYKAITHIDRKRINRYFIDKGTKYTMSTGLIYTGKYYSADRKKYIFDVIMPIYKERQQLVGLFDIGLSMSNIRKVEMILIIGVIFLFLSISTVISLFLLTSVKPRFNNLLRDIHRFESGIKDSQKKYYDERYSEDDEEEKKKRST